MATSRLGPPPEELTHRKALIEGLLEKQVPDVLVPDRLLAMAEDPLRFASDVLHVHLWSKQAEIAESVRDNRYTAVPSCHDAGKSFVASVIGAWWLSCHIPGEAFLVSTAPTFKQVRAILWREINQRHRAGRLPGSVNQTEWHMGRDLVGFGSKPADQDPDAFQGIHARYVLVLIDEACGVPNTIWQAAETLATNEGARILAIGNPDDPGSTFQKACKPNSGYHVIRIDGLETPNFTSERVPDRLRPLLLSRTWVEERKKKWGESSAIYQSKVRGLFPDISDDTLIPLSWIERAREREVEPEDDARQIAIDVARFGSDETTVALRRGFHVRIVASANKQDTMATAGMAVRAADEYGPIAIKVDVVGVGGGVVDRLVEVSEERVRDGHAPLPEIVEMSAGTKPIDEEHFVNARAEWFWTLRRLFELNLIDVEFEDEELAEQLSNIKFKIDSRGRILIESKDDMRKRGLPSPDRADSLAMAFAAVPYEEEGVYEEESETPIGNIPGERGIIDEE